MDRLLKSVIILFLSLAGVFLVGCGHEISKRELTVSAMTETLVRIDLFFKDQRRVPESLAALPKRAGYTNSTTNGWGHDLQYSVDADGVLELRSLGADGTPGGSGDDADLSWKFHTMDEAGNSIILAENWRRIAKLKGFPRAE